MTKQLEKLVVELEAKTARYEKQLAQAREKSRKFAKRTRSDFMDLRGAFALIGSGIITKQVIGATAKQEKAFKQLEQGIKSTSAAAGFAATQLADYASELQGVTTFGDEDIIASMSQLVTFTRITGDEFKRTTEAALDLATRFDIDLKSATLQLGKALNDPIANLSALSRSGIQFSEDQKTLIKSLTESGRQAEAQRVILEELERQFGGSAKAARDTFGGSIDALNNAFGDLLESDSGLNAAKQAIEDLTKTLSDPATKEGVNELTGAIIRGFAGSAAIVSKVTRVIRFLAEEFAAWINGPSVGDIPRIQEELDTVNDKIEKIVETQRKGGGTRLRQLQARKKTLEDILDTSIKLEQSTRKLTVDGGEVNIEPPKPKKEDCDCEEPKAEEPKAPQYEFISDPAKLNDFKTLMDEYKVVSESASLYIEDSFVNAFANISDNISNTLADAIVEGESLSEAFEAVGKALVKDMLAGLIKVGAQMALNTLFAQSAQAAIAASTLLTAKTLAVSWAPAATLASLATLGSNAAPAQAAISTTFGLSQGVALTGMSHDGITEIPKEGTWLLDKGERVLSAGQNADLSRFMQEQRGGVYQGNGEQKNITINLADDTFFSTNTIRTLVERISEEAGDMINVRAVSI